MPPILFQGNTALLAYHGCSYWIDCLVYSRSFALPPAVFSAEVLQSPAIQQALQLLTSGNPLDGMQFLKEVLSDPRQLPLRESASVLMGCMLMLARYHQEAAQILAAFSQDYPEDCHFPYYLALCQLKLGNYEAALNSLERALQLQSQFIPAWGAIGLIAGLMREHETALKACKTALAAGHEIGNQLLSLCEFQARLELGQVPFRNEHFDSNWFSPIPTDEHQALLERLPELRRGFKTEAQDSEHPLLFVAADSLYFHDHVVPLALSLIHTGSRCTLHVHVFNPDAEVERRLQSLAGLSEGLDLEFSYEQVNIETIAPAALYYSCIRFCRFFQVTDNRPGLSLMVDADALFRQPLQTLLAATADQPRPVVCHLPKEPIWQEVSAAFLLVDSSDHSRTFLANTSSAILRHLLQGKGRWFLDQMALYMAGNALIKQGCLTIGKTEASLVSDLSHSETSFIWQVSNDKRAVKFVEYRRELLANHTVSAVPFNTICQGKYGLIIANRHDQYIGRSLIQSGSWCDHELELLSELLRNGDVVVEAGANYGAHTLGLARMVGPSGQVHAFEPQRLIFQALTGTISLNSITHVCTYNMAVGSHPDQISVPRLSFDASNNFGAVSLLSTPAEESSDQVDYELVKLTTIDALRLEKCRLIKADVEGMELDVLRGAKRTIQRLQPILYLENHDDERRKPLIQHCLSLGYQLYWHGTNFDPNMLAIPIGSDYKPVGLTPIQTV